MAKVKVYNMEAKEVSDMELSDDLFGLDYNAPLIHEVVVAYNANQRQGTKSTLTRSEVRGHSKKPHKQKHTGRARQGSTKAPHQIGGGVAFAPKPRDFSKKVNKQAKRIALFSAISEKLRQNEITFIDDFKFEDAKTKEAQAFIDAFKFNKSVLVIVDKISDEQYRATDNIQTLEVENVNLLNVYEVVSNANIVMTKSAVKMIEEAYAE